MGEPRVRRAKLPSKPVYGQHEQTEMAKATFPWWLPDHEAQLRGTMERTTYTLSKANSKSPKNLNLHGDDGKAVL